MARRSRGHATCCKDAVVCGPRLFVEASRKKGHARSAVKDQRQLHFRVAAAVAGQAPFRHAHVELAAIGAGRAGLVAQVHDLRLRVGFQAHPLAFREIRWRSCAARSRRRWRPGSREHTCRSSTHPRAGRRRPSGSSTTKDTSPPRRNTAEIIRVSATVQAKCLHVLGVDEDLEGPPVARQNDIVDRDVERMFRCRAISPCTCAPRACGGDGPAVPTCR